MYAGEGIARRKYDEEREIKIISFWPTRSKSERASEKFFTTWQNFSRHKNEHHIVDEMSHGVRLSE
jgi:hypothetical protein